jgi:hypothetical protein
MDRTPTLLDDFDVAERQVITFPCARSLADGETISNAVVTCEFDHGVADAAAATRCATPCQVVGSDVLQLVTDAQPGTWYHVRGVITTSTGRVLVGACIFKGVRL